MTDEEDAKDRDRPPMIRVTVTVANRYSFGTEVVTGMQIKEKADVPARFSLHRRMRGGNVPIGDNDSVELHNGDHFFARPPGSARA